MGERHVHASWAADDFDLCIEVLRERLDEDCAQAAPRRSGGNLPGIVERLVSAEIERVARGE